MHVSSLTDCQRRQKSEWADPDFYKFNDTAAFNLGNGSFQPPGDARLVQIIRRHLHLHAIADRQAHPILAHLAGERSKNEMLIVNSTRNIVPGSTVMMRPSTSM